MPLDSDAQAIIDKFTSFNAPPLETLSPNAGRNNPTLKNAVEEMMSESFTTRALTLAKPNPEPVGKVSHLSIPGRDEALLARVFTPSSGTAPWPVLVYFHGGGWVIANLDVYEASCRALCNAAQCIVVSVAYRQAPEAKFPAAAEDASAALQWVVQNAASFDGDASRVAVGGESAGGNLATVACLMAKDHGGHLPVAQLLIYPVVDTAMNTPSYQECMDTVPLNSKMMPWFFKHYVGNGDKNHPYLAPLKHADLSGMPPAIVITAEFDPLRDEGEAYAHQLDAAGVAVSMRRFDGVPHEFFGLAGAISKAKEAVTFAAEGLQRAFTYSQHP